MKEKDSKDQKAENMLYPMDKGLIIKTQMNQSLRRKHRDIPRVTEAERQNIEMMLETC